MKLIRENFIGIPMIMGSSKTLATEVVKSSDDEIVFKLRQEYRPKLLPKGKVVDSMYFILYSVHFSSFHSFLFHSIPARVYEYMTYVK